MAHPYVGQAKSSQQARLKRLTGSAGKAHGSSSMYFKTAYPKGAGTQREYTISGGKGRSRPDRLASGGGVGKKRRPHATTNIIISHAGGRGGSGGGGGAGPPNQGAVPVPVPRPVPVPVGAGPGPMGPGPVPVRPPIAGGPAPIPVRPPVPVGAGPPPVGPPVGPPGMPVRPPGMKSGGAVKKRANGGFLKESKGKGYAGYPHSPTSEAGDKVSAHKAGGGVKKRQFGGGGLGTPSGGMGSGAPAQGGGLTGLLASSMPGRGAQQPIQGPATLSGRPMIPAQPLTVPQPKFATSLLQRPAPGTAVGYKKGGKVSHDDEAEDRKLFKKMIKAEKRARGGIVNPGNNPAPRGMPGSEYHQWGKGYQAGGIVKTPLKNTTGGGAGGKGRLAKTRAAKSVPDKTEA
jgi:hypothetical protein